MGEASLAALWWAVLLSGTYHGLNPGMGWPLAVSAALMERRGRALAQALGMLALGHFLAMAVVLLPFSVFNALVEWEQPIRLVAAGVAGAASVATCWSRGAITPGIWLGSLHTGWCGGPSWPRPRTEPG